MRLFVQILLTALIVLDLLLQPAPTSLSNQALCLILLAQIVLGLGVLSSSANGFSPFSFRFSYGTVFALFHFGLVGFMATGLAIPDFMLVQGQWMQGAAFARAITIATMGFMGYCLTAVALRPRAEPVVRVCREGNGGLVFGIVGLSVVGCSLGLWFISVLQAGGVGLLAGSYMGFLKATEASYVGVAYFGLGLGMCFLPLGSGGMRRIGFGLFGVFALVAVPLGLRGEVMFPFVVALVLLYRGRTVRWQYAVAGLMLTLVVIGAAREVRAVGVGNMDAASVLQSPASGVAELGGSIRPVQEVITWEMSGSRPRYGETYTVQIERLFERILGLPREDADQDLRIFNREISARVGPIGGSPVAEAFRNFETVGVLLRMMIMGALMSTLDRVRTDSSKRMALTGVVALPFFVEIRNDFTPVPVQLAVGVVLVLLASAATRRRGAATEN